MDRVVGRAALLLLLLQLQLCLLFTSAGSKQVGVCWGRSATDLPPASQTVQLLEQYGITRVRLFDSDSSSLKALAGSSIEVIVGVTNQELLGLAMSGDAASKWVENNVAAYVPKVNIKIVAVGSEVLTTTNLSQYLVSAMNNIHTALTKKQLDGSIKVSTPNSMSVLQKSYPPSAGRFNTSLEDVMDDMLSFLQKTGSVFMVNTYPYYAYVNDPGNISLNYALLQASTPVVDSGSGFKYYGLYEAQVDAVYAALSFSNYSQITVVVSEAGWPSKGDSGETAATVNNAQAFNGNLVKHSLSNQGTPGKVGAEIDVYIFALYNENGKPGPASERNWGLFTPDQKQVYQISFTSPGSSSSGGGGGSGGGGNGGGNKARAWCVGRPTASNSSLQAGLDWACGPQGQADCGPIQPGGRCFVPNTVYNHASYAFNSFWVRSGFQSQACNFSGAATLSTTDPSTTTCFYQSSLGSSAGVLPLERGNRIAIMAAVALLFFLVNFN